MKLLIAAAALALLASPALALDLEQGFKDADGKTPVQDVLSQDKAARCADRDGGPCLTLKGAVFHALLQPYSDEATLSGEDKFKRGALAYRLEPLKETTFSAQEVLLIKLVLGKMYSPIIVYQAYRMIDPGAPQ